MGESAIPDFPFSLSGVSRKPHLVWSPHQPPLNLSQWDEGPGETVPFPFCCPRQLVTDQQDGCKLGGVRLAGEA